MKKIDEQQMDALIAETFIRKQTVEEINRAVMREVRLTVRRRRLRRWVRLAAFSFGLPLVLLLFGCLMVKYVVSATEGRMLLLFTVVPTAAVLYGAWAAIANFSVGQDVINSCDEGLISEV